MNVRRTTADKLQTEAGHSFHVSMLYYLDAKSIHMEKCHLITIGIRTVQAVSRKDTATATSTVFILITCSHDNLPWQQYGSVSSSEKFLIVRWPRSDTNEWITHETRIQRRIVVSYRPTVQVHTLVTVRFPSVSLARYCISCKCYESSLFSLHKTQFRRFDGRRVVAALLAHVKSKTYYIKCITLIVPLLSLFIATAI